jgi:hypothetical protein
MNACRSLLLDYFYLTLLHTFKQVYTLGSGCTRTTGGLGTHMLLVHDTVL